VIQQKKEQIAIAYWKIEDEQEQTRITIREAYPADKFNYGYNYNYNRYNPDDKYLLDEDHDWWYVNIYIPQRLS